jgi:hypothetical protein
MGKNAYLNALIDPENSAGCRVPDMVTVPSSTVQLTFDGTISPTGTGDGVVVLITPDFALGGTNGSPLQLWANATAGGNYAVVSQLAWSQRSALVALFDQYRPVSGVLYGEFIGNSTADSGQILMGWLPRVLPVAANPTPIAQLLATPNFASVLTQSFTKTIPLRNGAVVTWKPQDNQDLEYSYVSNDNAGGNYFPSIYFATSGQQTTAAVRYRVVFNFELIPTVDTALFLSPEPSVSDISQLEQAMNWTSSAYSNLSAFVSNVSPYVQPVLGRLASAGSAYAGQAAYSAITGGYNGMSSRGNSLRLTY